MNLETIKETLKQAQRAQATNWGYLYYRDVSWLIEQIENLPCVYCLGPARKGRCANPDCTGAEYSFENPDGWPDEEKYGS